MNTQRGTRAVRRIGRVAAAAAVAVGVAAASSVVSVEPAQAGNAFWTVKFYRWPKDGDAGGISGAIKVFQTSDPSRKAYVNFRAKGEKTIVFNNTGKEITVRLLVDEKWAERGLIYPGDMTRESTRRYPQAEGLRTDLYLEFDGKTYDKGDLRT